MFENQLLLESDDTTTSTTTTAMMHQPKSNYIDNTEPKSTIPTSSKNDSLIATNNSRVYHSLRIKQKPNYL